MQRSILWVTIIFVLGLLALTAGGVAIYRSQSDAVHAQIESDLASVAQLKTAQLVEWRHERLEEGAEVMARPLLRALLLQMLAEPARAADETLRAELGAIQDHSDYLDVLLVDAAGAIRYSLSGSQKQIDMHDELAHAIRNGAPVMTDLHSGTYTTTPHISVFAPILDQSQTAQGALVLVTDARHFLYPLIQSWPASSDTAETLLVRRDGDDVLYLNDLRHQSGTALALRIPLTADEVPGVMAVQGQEGVVTGRDYRGVEVLAALRTVPDSPWSLVAKMDTSEALAGWHERSAVLVLLLIGAAALLGAFVLILWQYKRRQQALQLIAAERAQRTSELRYAVTLHSIGEGVIATDAQGRVTMLNAAAEALTGWTDAAAHGRPLAEVFATVDEEISTAVANPVEVVLREGAVVGLGNHTLLRDRRDHLRPIANAAAPIRNDDGDILGVVLVFRDQSTERAAKRALEQSEGRLAAMLAAIPDLIFRIDRDYRFLDCQVSDPNLLLFPREQFLGKRIFDVLPAEVAEGGAQAIARALSSGMMQVFEYTLDVPSGRAWYEQRIAPISPTEVIAITRDVSDTRRNEVVMQTRLRLLEFANDHPLGELLTKTLDEVGALVNSPVGFYHFVEANQQTISLQAWSTRTMVEFCTADGHSFHYPVTSAGVWADAVRQHQPVIHNDYASLPNRRGMPAGHATLLRELVVPILRQDRVVAILGLGNKPTDYTDTDMRLVCYLADVAWEIVQRKRVEAEQASLQQQLAQAQKLETIGQLAGGIAHDFNNMLAVILMRSEMALQQVDPASPLHHHLTEIYNTGQRSADLTRKLLGFARKQMIAPRVLDLNDAISGMMQMLQRLIGENLDLQWCPITPLWPVKMDRSQIDQILVNLCVNARDANASSIKIQTENAWIDDAYAALHPPLHPGQYVMLTVTDDGSGMTQAVLDHVFEPFFTTKEVGKGTGLGLATIYGIVQQNRGHILVYSEYGIGTSFKLFFPCDEASMPAQSERPVLTTPHSRGETILLVEDELPVLEMGAETLRALGYAVYTAATPAVALAISATHRGEFDLLLTDVIMPELNGRELAQRIVPLQPGIKYLFMSGYPAYFVSQRGVLDADVQFISKPFTLHQLAVAVRQALDGA